ncbi:hypothetical protein [Streptomyces sp. NPDC127098]|uniref:hypothetical protein n=1 Tax=Streptomyces sp. NPDC127098 TaxID=3347137 RepID=UPI0036583B3D
MATVSDLARGVIASVHLLLDLASDDPERVIGEMEAVFEALREERVRLESATVRVLLGESDESEIADQPDLDFGPSLPHDVAAGIRLLLARTAGPEAAGNLERRAVELTANKLGRFVRATTSLAREADVA